MKRPRATAPRPAETQPTVLMNVESFFVFREWGRSRHDGGFVGIVIGDAAVREELHAMDDSAG